jgi:hypothetical protein
VAVYVAFSDEAAIADADGEFLVAGYAAQETNWPSIASAWQERVLDGPPRIPELHMTEIRSGVWRKENSISFNDAENRVAEAVRILHGTGSLTAMASVIKRKDLREIVHSLYPSKKKIPRGLDEPDYACYMAYLTIMLIRVHAIYSDATRVNFIVSHKNKQITKGIFERTEENRMWDLLKERDGAIHTWEREDLEKFVEDLRKGGKI